MTDTSIYFLLAALFLQISFSSSLNWTIPINVNEEILTASSRYSELIRLGECHYLLKNICISPRDKGFIRFYYNATSEPPYMKELQNKGLTLCNEFSHPIFEKFTLLPSRPPRRSKGDRNVTWIKKGTPVVEYLSSNAPWHILNHVITFNQLVSKYRGHFQDSRVLFFPTFFGIPGRENFWSILNKSRYPFDPKTLPFWRIWQTAVPSNMSLVQVNLIESTGSNDAPISADFEPNFGQIWAQNLHRRVLNPTKEGGKENGLPWNFPEVSCYKKLFLASPLMRVRWGFNRSPDNSSIWGEVVPSYLKELISRVVEWAGAEKMTSDFCPHGEPTRLQRLEANDGKSYFQWTESAPFLILLNRRDHRKIVNLEEVRQAIKRFGFNFAEVYWEDMDLKEQIRFVRTADVLLGGRGSGLTHVLWMRKESTLIEVLPERHRNVFWGKNKNKRSDFGSLSYFAGVNHFMVKKNIDESLVAEGRTWQDLEIVAPLKRLQLALAITANLMDKKCTRKNPL